MKWFKRLDLVINGFDGQFQFNDLAAYNAEISRGIIHSKEYKSKMLVRQDVYNKQILLFLSKT